MNWSMAYPHRQGRVPHISLVFREMWDTTELNVLILDGVTGKIRKRTRT
jgi:hypothetical protein